MDKEEMIEIIQEYEHELWKDMKETDRLLGKKTIQARKSLSKWAGINELMDKLDIISIL